MIELRLEGLPTDVDAAHEQLVSTFDIRYVSKDYSNKSGKLIRRFIRAEPKTGLRLDKARLTLLIRTFLEISHAEMQTPATISDTLAAYHDGYQSALLDLARSTGVVPDSESETDWLKAGESGGESD